MVAGSSNDGWKSEMMEGVLTAIREKNDRQDYSECPVCGYRKDAPPTFVVGIYSGGSVVDCVYEVKQYQPSACFGNFMQQVTSARREADSDPTESILGSSCKLLGNSSYGRSLMRKEQHQDVTVLDEDGALKATQNPYLNHLTQIMR